MPVESWRYESRRERRRRQIAALQDSVSRSLEPFYRGDYGAARQAFRGEDPDPVEPLRFDLPETEAGEPGRRMAPGWGSAIGKITQDVAGGVREPGTLPKRDKGGGILSKLGAAFDAVTPDAIEPGLRKGLEYLDKPREYVGGPLFSLLTGATGVESQVDPETGQRYRSKPGFGDVLSGLGEAFTRDPRETYQEGRQAANERLADPELSAFERTLLGGFSDPLSYIGVGAVNRGLRFLPEAVRASRGFRAGAALVESPGRASAGGVIGAGLGAQFAEETGADPRGTLLATLGGGLVGGGLASGLTPERVARGVDALSDIEGRLTAEPELGAVVMPRLSAEDIARDRALGLPDYSAADLFNLPTIEFKPQSRVGVWVDTVKAAIDMPVDDAATRAVRAVMRARERLKPVVESQANITAAKVQAVVSRTFKTDSHGRITDIVGAPTVQDLAARLPEFAPLLTPRQLEAMELLRRVMAPWEKVRIQRGDTGSRLDIVEGGFYLPRGRADIEGADAPLASGGRRRGGKPGSERHADYRSMVEGIEDGKRYAPLAEAVESMALEQGRYTVDRHIADSLKTVRDPETGNLIGSTPADRMDPVVRARWKDLTGELVKLRGRLTTAEKRASIAVKASDEVDDALQRFERATPETGGRDIAKVGTELGRQERRGERLAERAEGQRADKPRRKMTAGGPVRIDTPATAAELRRTDILEARSDEVGRVVDRIDQFVPEDVDRLRFLDTALLRTARRAEDLAQRGGDYADTATAIRSRIAEIQGQIDELRPEYQRALEKSRATPRGEAAIDMPGATLSGYTFPEAIAAAANKFLSREGRTTGFLSRETAVVRELNSILRAINATGEFSFIGIQGIIGAARNPVGAGRAIVIAMKALADESVIGKYYMDFDARAAKLNRPGTEWWASRGLRQGGLDNVSEFGFSRDVRQRGVIAAAGRAIGRTPVIKQTNRAFGNYGDVMRLELADSSLSMAKLAGFDPGDPETGESIADAVNRATGWSQRRFAGDMGEVALFAPRFFQSQLEFAAQALAGSGPGALEARRSLVTFLGVGIGLSALMNELSDDPVPWDEFWQPMKDGRRNANFLRFRVAGQDVSLFGPWDSLAGGIVATIADPTGGLTQLYRSKSSPLVSRAWDVFTGKDFKGEPVTFGDVMRGLAPFAYQELGSEPWEKTAIGLVGVKASPKTPSEELDTLARAQFGKGFYDLAAADQKAIKDAHPEVWERAVERGSKLRVANEEVKQRYRQEQEQRDARLLAGEITLEQWEKARQDARAMKAGEQAQIYRDTSFPDRDSVMDAYYGQIDAATVDGVTDWDAVDAWLDGQSDADRAEIERNTGLNDTPMQALRRRLSKEYYALPRYRGYSADEAREIDALWQEVRNNARGSDTLYMLRALRKADTSGYSEKAVRGVRRRILGMLREDRSRERYRRDHPEVLLLNGSGRLTPDMAAVLEAAIR